MKKRIFNNRPREETARTHKNKKKKVVEYVEQAAKSLAYVSHADYEFANDNVTCNE